MARIDRPIIPLPRQEKPEPEELLGWALGVDPGRVRANGQHLADDLDRLYPARPARIDLGAVHALFWAIALVVVASIVIVGCSS